MYQSKGVVIKTKLVGLTKEEVAERKRAGQSNAPVEAPFKSNWQIVKSNTFTYFNAIFVVLAVLLIAVGSLRDITFLPVIIANTLIGIFQELKAKVTLEKLTVLSASKVTVVRDGQQNVINVNKLVVDDIVIFKPGDQIPADAIVIEGSAAVNEALITGEADEIQKTENSELLSGSFIVSGEVVARVTKVGADAYVNKLTLRAKAIKTKEQSEIIRSLNKIVKMAGMAIIPIGVLLFTRQYFFLGASVTAAVQGMAAAIIGMIPEGLFLLASVSLAISAIKLGQKKVLLHEMKSVETLAHVDVFCIDKTGTITSPEMVVQEIVEIADDFKRENLAALAHGLTADNVTMAALQEFLKKPRGVKPGKTFGFSSQYKYSAAEIDGRSYVVGAPQFVLREDYESYKKQVESYTRKGYRVLVFGRYGGKLTGKELTAKVRPEALVILTNPVRETAPATFQYFADQGVAIKVISGDDPLTVAEVARQAGIENAEKHIDASGLKTKEDYAAAVEKYTVFGRVLPEQKRELIKALQKQGHTVAMAGDGVNDVLALKDADCSIAVASGADAAVQAAQLVLLDSDFSKMPSVVLEGRRVVNNLERSGSLFIVKNIFSFIAAILSILIGFRYPLLPAQVSMVTTWIIGAPSFFLAQMPNHDLIKGRFIENILKKAVSGGLTNVILILFTYMVLSMLGLDVYEKSTACTIVFAISGMIYLYRLCQPFDWYRRLIWSGCFIGLLICFLPLNWLFNISENLPVWAAVVSSGIGLLAYPLLIGFDEMVRRHWRVEIS